MAVDCPQCGYPLDIDGYCPWCKTVPEWPPPHAFARSPVRIEFGVPPGPAKLVKRFEFERDWRAGAVSSREILDLVYTSGSGAKPASTSTGSVRAAALEAAANAVMDILQTSDEVTRIALKPTAWDEYLEDAPARGAELRIGEGIWFAAGDVLRLAIPLTLSLLHTADMAAWPILLKEGGRIAKLLRKGLDAYVRLDGVDRDVFEAVYRFRKTLAIANYDALTAGDWERAYAFDRPTAQKIAEELSLPLEVVQGSLIRLSRREIVKSDDRERWSIRL